MKRSTGIIFAVIAIAVIAFIVFSGRKAEQNSGTPSTSDGISQFATTSSRTYKNATYGFSLEYPSDLQEKTYGQNDAVFGYISGSAIRGVVEARVVIVQGNPGETFGQAATRELRGLCAADGPTTTFSCTAVEKIQPFPSASGVLGVEFYLKGELKALSTGKITVISKGPYFAFPIQSGSTGSSVLVIHPPLNQSAVEAASTTIEAVAKSVRLEAPQKGDVLLQAYISEHLAQLSSVKAQVGGTFFVTKIEAKDGKGIVEYEDGHNAYTADFTYSTDSAGKITVNTFKVRK